MGDLPFCPELKYLGVTLYRSLTYRLTPWVTSQKVCIARRTVRGPCWLWLGCWANNVGNSHLSPGLFNRSVLRSCPVQPPQPWSIQPQCTALLSGAAVLATTHWATTPDAWRIVAGCLCPTPADNLPILSDIRHAELRRNEATLCRPACRAMEPGNLLLPALTCPPSGNARHFKSRRPFVPAAQKLISSSDNNNIRAALWVDHR